MRDVYDASYAFEKVDIFLRVHDRLPMEDGDGLTQKTLDDYCRKFENGELTQGLVPLDYMYGLIKSGKIKPTNEEDK